MERKTAYMRKRVARAALTTLVVVFLALESYPIVWMLMASVKSPTEFVTKPSFAWPGGLYLKNYTDAWTTGKMGVFFANSVIATSAALVLIVVLSFLVSFAITKMEWHGRQLLLAVFMTGILVPVQVVLIPLFVIFKAVGLLNTRLGLSLIYAAFGMSMSVFLMTGYLRYLPDELLEAGIIDGCGLAQLLWRIVVPLAQNAIVTIVVIQFFVAWNDLIFSMTFISSQALKTVQTGMLYFQTEYGTKEWGPIFAAISIAVVPTIGLYAMFNKLVIQGMTEGAVKA